MNTFNLCQKAFPAGALMLLFTAGGAWAHCGGKHGPGHPHCAGGGQEDPVFTADSVEPGIAPVDSYSLDAEDTVVFRNATIDFSSFEGTWSGSGDACNHGLVTGTFSLRPQSSQNPETAVMTSYFQSVLENGETKMHFFYFEGVFDEPGNWPPSEADPVTTLTFDYWELHAENKKAQREDCAGESPSAPDPNGPWTITVTRQP